MWECPLKKFHYLLRGDLVTWVPLLKHLLNFSKFHARFVWTHTWSLVYTLFQPGLQIEFGV